MTDADATLKARIVAAIRTHGSLTAACKALGLPRPQVYAWRKADAAFGAAVDRARAAPDPKETAMPEPEPYRLDPDPDAEEEAAETPTPASPDADDAEEAAAADEKRQITLSNVAADAAEAPPPAPPPLQDLSAGHTPPEPSLDPVTAALRAVMQDTRTCRALALWAQRLQGRTRGTLTALVAVLQAQYGTPTQAPEEAEHGQDPAGAA